MLRKLKETNLKEIRYITEIHESLPKAWIDNYIVDKDEIEKNARILTGKLKTSNAFCCIVEEKDQIISFIWAEVNRSNSKIVDIISLWTNESYRGEGIATKLKIELENWTRENTKAKKISTTVSSNNEKMINLNEKLGYEINYYKMTKSI